MKIDELKRIAKENEYSIKKYDEFKVYKLVRKIGEYDVVVNTISIDADIRNRLFLNTVYSDENDMNMIKAAVEFAETAIEDREEEKKFYLKHRWIKGCVIMYLYRNTLNGYCYLGDKKCRPHRQKMFTLKEIEEIKEKFDTDLVDFELVEVAE